VNLPTGQLATKNDLEAVEQRLMVKLATKEELRQEVAKLATKEELEKVKKSLERVANQVALNTTDITEIKHNVSRLESVMSAKFEQVHEKFDVVLQAIDGLAGKVDSYHTEKAAVDHGLRRHDKRLDEHESRIANVEAKLA